MTETPKENILLPEEIVCTKNIQLRSLKNFMHALGYTYAPDNNQFLFSNECYFESYDYDNRSRSNIAFNTACKLHDFGKLVLFSIETPFSPPFDFDKYKIKRAMAARIVCKLKLQLNKRTGVITHNSNLIEFVDPSYTSMLSYAKHIV